MRVHAQLNSEEVDETEEEIITRFASVLSGKSLEASNRILVGTLNVIAAKKGQSVVLYIYCKTLKDLIHLQEMNASGKLRTIIQTIFTQLLSHVFWTKVNVENLKSVVESLFNQLLCQSQIHQITIDFDDDEYNKCRSYFPGENLLFKIIMSRSLPLHTHAQNSLEISDIADHRRLRCSWRKFCLWPAFIQICWMSRLLELSTFSCSCLSAEPI